MRAISVALALLVAALSGCNSGTGKGICGCDPNTEVCLSGRCFPSNQQTPVTEPTATRASCPAFTQVAAPPIPNTPPAAGCPIPVPAQSSTPDLAVPVTLTGGAPAGDERVGTTVLFTVPAGATGMTIVLQGVNVPVTSLAVRDSTGTFQLQNTAVPLRLTAPDTTVWYDDLQTLAADGSQDFVFFGSTSPLVGSLSVPNTTKALTIVGTSGLPSGAWTLVVNDYANECATALSAQCGPLANLVPAPDFTQFTLGTYRTTVLVRQAPTALPTINVGFYVQRCPGADYDSHGACCGAPPVGQPVTTPGPGGTSTCTVAQTELTAARAADPQAPDPDAQRMLSTYASLLAGGGICLGVVTWYDLPQWAQDRWAAGLDLDATSCDVGLEQLLTVSQPHAGGQMNLFLMPDLLAKNGTSTTQIVGIDGTIPGPGTFSGTVQSGAAVSGASLRDAAASCTGALSLSCGADVTAYIAAHETGHYLGLYHTTESGGNAFDPISDTLPCQCRSCLSSTLVGKCGTAAAEVTGNDCNKSTTTCGGGTNLMFWLLSATSTGKLSPQQSQVMLSSPLVH